MAKNGGTALDLHRQAWLDAHPERDEAWLLRMAKEGFDIHHVDGDHENNAPQNLVLIEHRDHFMLHSGKRPPLGRLANLGALANARQRAKRKAIVESYHWYAEMPARQMTQGLTPDERQADAIAEYENAKRALVESL